MDTTKRIAIHHPPGIAIWDDILRGIFRFARPDFQWRIATNFERDLKFIQSWKPEGIIAQCTDAETADFLKRLNVPVVNVARERVEITFPSLQIDDFAVGEMAARYFLDRGFQSLACYTLTDRAFMETRLAGFREVAASNGIEVSVFESKKHSNNQMIEAPSESLQHWLRGLPDKTAILATTDALGVVLVSACRYILRSVPEELAILGVSNNELFCNLEYPPLSSIRIPGEYLGFEAARRLNELLQGSDDGTKIRRLQPIDVASRQSTDIYCIEDDAVAAALTFIKEHFGEPINVGTISKASQVSRSSLERRFRKLLGRSILDELTSQRLKAAKKLLFSSDLSLKEISQQTGFTNSRQFSATFKKHVGEQPNSFRQRTMT